MTFTTKDFLLMSLLLTEYLTVQNVLNEKFENLLEEFTTNEFVTEVGDKIFEETGKTFDDEEVKEMIGETLFSHLLLNVSLLINNQ
jgi:hypothetical protein